MKKIQATEFVTKNPEFRLENKEGHYTVIGPDGVRYSMSQTLPNTVEANLAVTAEAKITSVTEEAPAKKDRKGTKVLDKETGKTYASKHELHVALALPYSQVKKMMKTERFVVGG